MYERNEQMFALPVARYDQLPHLASSFARITPETRREGLETFLTEMQKRYLQLQRLPRRDFEASVSGPGGPILRALQQDGYLLHAMAEDDRRRIRDYATPIAHEIMRRLDSLEELKFSAGQEALDPAQHAPLYLAVEKALIDCGVLPAFSAYAGRDLGLLRLVAQVNTERETRLKYGEIDAQGLPQHRTSYFHVDSTDWPTVKALIYVSDVGPDEGPFRYVRGSHRLMGDFEAVVRKTNDKLRQDPTRFLALPCEFGQHANFGDFIDEATPGAKQLLANEIAAGDGRSDLALFDNNGVHRGGFVRSGHRFMLQCHFSSASKIAERRQGALAARAALQTA